MLGKKTYQFDSGHPLFPLATIGVTCYTQGTLTGTQQTTYEKVGATMSKNLSYGLIGLAVVLVLFGLLNHFVLGLKTVPHSTIIIGVLAVILGAVGVYGMLSASRAA